MGLLSGASCNAGGWPRRYCRRLPRRPLPGPRANAARSERASGGGGAPAHADGDRGDESLAGACRRGFVEGHRPLASIHLDRAYDSKVTRGLLEDRRLVGVISQKGKLASLEATKRWVVERTNSWSNAHKKLVWCTEREGRVIDFWIAFSNAIIIVGRLIRQAWSRYRWETRPTRRP